MRKLSFFYGLLAVMLVFGAVFYGVEFIEIKSVYGQSGPTATATPTPPTNQNPTATPPIIPGQNPGPNNQNPTVTPTPPRIPGGTTDGRSGNDGGSGGSTDSPSRNPNKPEHENIAHADQCGYFRGMERDEVPDQWQDCRKCVYPGFGEGEINPLSNQTLKGIPTPDIYHIYTDFGCLSTDPGEFASQISTFFFSIVGAIAFLFFIYGAGIIATSRSDPGKLNQGKRIVYGSIIGLLFALSSVFIIRFIATGIGLPF